MPTPDLFTVTEAAVVLHLGRTTAYERGRCDLAAGGAEGLDVRRIGGRLRLPRAALEQIRGRSISWPPDSRSALVRVDRPPPIDNAAWVGVVVGAHIAGPVVTALLAAVDGWWSDAISFDALAPWCPGGRLSVSTLSSEPC